jgi:general secretion pathway protein G
MKKTKNNFKKKTTTNELGYSLLEVLIVLAIMGLLATLVAPRLFTQLDKSKITTAKAQTEAIRLALDSFRLDVGRYPTMNEGLKVLTDPPKDNDERWFGPYLDGDLPADPWGNEFIYKLTTVDGPNKQSRPKVISLGADNAQGGSGNDADISS